VFYTPLHVFLFIDGPGKYRSLKTISLFNKGWTKRSHQRPLEHVETGVFNPEELASVDERKANI
jgi:hypothetical protein